MLSHGVGTAEKRAMSQLRPTVTVLQARQARNLWQLAQRRLRIANKSGGIASRRMATEALDKYFELIDQVAATLPLPLEAPK